MIVEKTISLTGALEGKTITLNGYNFVDGDLTFKRDKQSAENLCRYFVRSYQVAVSGSDEPTESEPIGDSDDGAVSLSEDKPNTDAFELESGSETDESDSGETTTDSVFTD